MWSLLSWNKMLCFFQYVHVCSVANKCVMSMFCVRIDAYRVSAARRVCSSAYGLSRLQSPQPIAGWSRYKGIYSGLSPVHHASLLSIYTSTWDKTMSNWWSSLSLRTAPGNPVSPSCPVVLRHLLYQTKNQNYHYLHYRSVSPLSSTLLTNRFLRFFTA